MYKPMFLLSLFLLSLRFGYAQKRQIEKSLDSLFAASFTPAGPGCAVLVAKKGQIIYKKSFGSANIELNVPLAPDMVFKLASITKQFTAIATLQLAEQGKLSLTDSIQAYLPGYPSKGHVITIEHLLTHTAGIPDYMQLDFQHPNMERWDFRPGQLIDSFKQYPLQFAPGTKFSYSNSGYYLLGYIIEKVSGKSYQSYVQEHILSPLRLSHSFFDRDGAMIPARVNGYRREGSDIKNADFWSPSLAYAAGGLLSNTEDLYKWFSALLAYKLVKKETLKKAFTPFRLADSTRINYGYGWYVFSSGSVASIEHGGHMNGFVTNQIYFPEQDVFMALLFNTQDAPRDELSQKAAVIVLGQPLQKSVSVKKGILESYTGTYKLATDPGRTIAVTKKDDRLVATFSARQTLDLLFQDETTFSLQNIKGLTGTFIRENGKITKIIMEQNGRFEWTKVP